MLAVSSLVANASRCGGARALGMRMSELTSISEPQPSASSVAAGRVEGCCRRQDGFHKMAKASVSVGSISIWRMMGFMKMQQLDQNGGNCSR